MSAGDSISGYGLEWEAVIGRTRAQEITAVVPQAGYERLVASGVPDRQQRLFLQNCGGTLVLASTTTPVVLWEAAFGAEWARYARAAQRQAQANLERVVLGQLEHFFDISQAEVDLTKLAAYAPRYEWDSRSCDLNALTAAAMAYGRDHGLTRWSASNEAPAIVRDRG